MSRIMTTAQIMRMTQQPTLLYEQLVKMFQQQGLAINQEKTLANVEQYDQKSLPAGRTQTFFDGEATTLRTNLASFIKPETEHTLIYAIRVQLGDDSQEVGVDEWLLPSALPSQAIQNSNLTVNINGVTVIKRYPFTAFFTDVEAGDNYAAIVLEVPLLWGGQQEMQVTVQNGFADYDPDTSLKIAMVGIGLI